MKSGNHTKMPQWIYCGIHMIFYIIPNPFVFKMGIGGSWMDRTSDIGKSMKLPGFILPFFLVWVPFAYQIEKWTHQKMKFLNIRYFGSGKTEWFFVLGILFAIPVMAAAFTAWAGFWVLLVSYAIDNEKGAQIALKWLAENWRLFLVWVGMGKVMVIFGQIIMRR